MVMEVLSEPPYFFGLCRETCGNLWILEWMKLQEPENFQVSDIFTARFYNEKQKGSSGRLKFLRN